MRERRFKIELTLNLAALANTLRAGAYWSTANESGWLVRPELCNWSDPDKAGGPPNELSVKLEAIHFSGAPRCLIDRDRT